MCLVPQVGTVPTIYGYNPAGAGSPFVGKTVQPGSQTFTAYYLSGIAGALPATLGSPTAVYVYPPAISIRISG